MNIVRPSVRPLSCSSDVSTVNFRARLPLVSGPLASFVTDAHVYYNIHEPSYVAFHLHSEEASAPILSKKEFDLAEVCTGIRRWQFVAKFVS